MVARTAARALLSSTVAQSSTAVRSVQAIGIGPTAESARRQLTPPARRATSASTTPVATDAFSDSTARTIGIDTVTSHTVRVSRDNPRPSEPTTITSGEVASSKSSVSTVPSASRPAIIRPFAA